jgi:hypothetical protein
MIVILASQNDTSARRLTERWAGDGARLLTPADLSLNGWRYRSNEPLDSTAVLAGKKVEQSAIHGVFNRLPWVWEGELFDIVSDDRMYVAAEMSAFLLCWLAGLSCPVLNRPTAGCLNGPGWSHEQWSAAASKAGMRVQPIRRKASFASPGTPIEEVPKAPPTSVTVVGDRCLGDAHSGLLTQARSLAGLAKVDFLAVKFSGSESDARFVSATASPDIDADTVTDAVLDYLRDSAGKSL